MNPLGIMKALYWMTFELHHLLGGRSSKMAPNNNDMVAPFQGNHVEYQRIVSMVSNEPFIFSG